MGSLKRFNPKHAIYVELKYWSIGPSGAVSGFEPRRFHHSLKRKFHIATLLAQLGEHYPERVGVVGSRPTCRRKIIARLVREVRCHPYKMNYVSSSLTPGTKFQLIAGKEREAKARAQPEACVNRKSRS